MQSKEELRTTHEVAERLKVTPATVARWVRTGRLNALRLPGGQLRFRESDIAAIVDGRGGKRLPGRWKTEG